MANGEKLPVTQWCAWRAEIDGRIITDVAYLLPQVGDGVEMIIGTPALQRYQMWLEFSEEGGEDIILVTKPELNFLL